MFSAAKPLSVIKYFHSTLRALSPTTTTTTMAASKFLIALMLVLAITGSVQGQMSPAEQAIVVACGIPAAIKMKPLSPSCTKGLTPKAKACPGPCKSLLKLVKTAACADALNAVTPVANQQMIAKVSR